MYQRAQLKQSVKQTIAGTRPRPMWVTLLYLIVSSIGGSIISGVINGVSGMNALSTVYTDLMLALEYDIEAVVEELIFTYANQLATLVGSIITASLLTGILMALWNGLMTVGFNGYCLSLVKGENPGIDRVFCGFPMFGKVILTALLVWVFTSLWTLLYALILIVCIVVGALFIESVPAVGAIIMVAGYALFLFLMVRLTLRYAMTNYILLDTGKYGLEAITESKKMMKGKKGKLFGLYFSFIGWYLLMYAVMLVGVLLFAVLLGVGGAGVFAGGASFGAVAGMVGGAVFVMIVMVAAIYLISIWLQPYITGSEAKFYLHFKPQEPAPVQNWPTLGDSTVTESDSEY